MTCTNEELALLVTLNGYPNVAKGIAEASIGERSSREWNAIMEVTIHQLILKGMWDNNKEKNGDVPIPDELKNFIESYVNSKWMFRCSNTQNKSLLNIHHIDGETWLSHIVERDIIHEFSYITIKEIPEIVREYYAFDIPEHANDFTFHLSDKAFDLLNEKRNVKKVHKISNFPEDEEKSFLEFVEDLKSNEWILSNISYFHIPDYNNDPLLQNIVFFLPSSTGIWVVEYLQNTLEQPVRISLKSSDDWLEIVSGIEEVAHLNNSVS